MLRILLCLAMAVIGCRAACNVCATNDGTTCVSETSFMFCGDQIPMNCPTDLYCTDGNRICQSKPELVACRTDTATESTSSTTSSTTQSTTSTIQSSTSTTTSAPTTVDPVIIEMCQSKATAGRYSNPNDTSCRSYVICVYRDSVWTGNVWKCPSNKPYFSSITSTCGTILSSCV